MTAEAASLPPPADWLDLAETLAGVGFWRMDPATGHVDWSPNMFHLFEFPPGAAPRADETMSRIHPDDRAAAYVDLSSNLQEGGHVSISRIMLPSGGVRVVESHTTTQRDAAGEVSMIVGSVLDITARVERERKLLEARNRAEQGITQQTANAADLSHEIRTPLMAIIGYAHLLAKHDDLSPGVRREVEHIAHSSTALLSVANNVLGRSRAAATLSETELAPVPVLRIAQDVLDIFDEQAAAKGVKLRHDISEDLPAYLNTHADALTQILVNLVGNAVKFTDHGSITVSIDYDEHFELLSIGVADTGRGFDDVTREALFRRFSRGSDAHQIPSGAGLGLSICKGLVEALHGTIEVDSTRGAGSRFTVTIHASPSAEPGNAGLSRSKSASVLVVDDHPAILEISARILEAAGAQVVTAQNGASALQLAQSRQFDLVLIDLNLPDMSGLAVAEDVRSREGPNARSRLVAFTAADIDASRLSPSFDGYLAKPVDPLLLAALVLGA